VIGEVVVLLACVFVGLYSGCRIYAFIETDERMRADQRRREIAYLRANGGRADG
jgi:hypothetical protein